MSYFANFWVYRNGRIIEDKSESLEAENDKEAFEEARVLTEKLNDDERVKESTLRYGLSYVARIMREVTLENVAVWLDKQTFKEFHPNEKYPKNEVNK